MRKQTSTNWINEKKITANCGMGYTLRLIGGRWKAGILWALLDSGRSRFSEIRDQLSGVSERMLAKQLGELEEDQLINRIVYPEVPPRVEYELTELGHSMEPMLQQMSDWGEMHREETADQA
ncbi:winged helix-turn-helix transcriptional regulator [Aliifodinibius sp. S!AR15-10]|uniref:winged helix-turn-helix transcriptional regulator n=1 Tax=Aliifodinibius sp. S!AR15-10 TaxID=2950437 RepID=UPI002855861F|nr:winged helix-turn-helix transcriptional regulator [Aliifodinibius sp. S!AR15-10]MDR8393776.1 winged helix-turn-helix transcriptional regulator [Aliifodinibius sp. S!AR15-10]